MPSVSVLLLALFLLVGAACATMPTQIDTTGGTVKGYVGARISYYSGIPFAAPPVGTNRFREPQPPTPWSGVRDATTMGNICPQAKIGSTLVLGNEDCLYLNVYVPSNHSVDANETLPVMFWIYGGGFMMGDAYEFGFYDPTHLVEKHNVIIVTHNYRLNVFGYLAHPDLQQDSALNSTGNYGIQDQRMAMQWVQNNIAKFGGDKNRVTIFGESAGGMSICCHIVSPYSKGLFAGAIMESGGCDTPAIYQETKYAFEWGDTYSSAIGCNVTELGHEKFLTCLRGLSTAEVLRSIGSLSAPSWPYTDGKHHSIPAAPLFSPIFYFTPAVDGSPHGLEDIPLNLISKGKFNRVPLIAGTNHDEGTIFVPFMLFVIKGFKLPVTDQNVVDTLNHFFDEDDVEPILKMYPVSDFKDNFFRLAFILRDNTFLCSTRRLARAHSGYNAATWVYQFDYAGDWLNGALGDYHTSELPYVFGNAFPPILHPPFSANDQAMSDTLQYYWTNFARNGDPNSGNNKTMLNWPNYTPLTELTMGLEQPAVVYTKLENEKCDFWDTVTPKTHVSKP